MGMREGPVCHEMSKYLSEPAANERRLGTAQPCCCEPSLPALSYMLIFYGFPCDTAYLPWQAQLAMGQCRGLPLPGRWDIPLVSLSTGHLKSWRGSPCWQKGGDARSPITSGLAASLHFHWSTLLIAVFLNNTGINNDLLGLK